MKLIFLQTISNKLKEIIFLRCAHQLLGNITTNKQRLTRWTEIEWLEYDKASLKVRFVRSSINSCLS